MPLSQCEFLRVRMNLLLSGCDPNSYIFVEVVPVPHLLWHILTRNTHLFGVQPNNNSLKPKRPTVYKTHT